MMMQSTAYLLLSAAFPLRLACRYKQTGLQADQVVSCIIDEQA